ncbi:putative RNA polymerase II transcription factor SIII, subunit A [Medicago truncatula]|uniref:Putative RNA polymerase II transcription factor SIII, subunit A n=1 Tax=Medicago truncatula TaxID=3880 RepID=A0A396GA19_MEDTR|nr:putative RNA polymerase II transcription factor SIII, subunit A [Medicago truncatula]
MIVTSSYNDSKAIDNVKYLGDVSHVDHHMLERILPHCTLDQLMHIEKSTQGMDLSPITDQLWKKFFEKQFGINCTNEVVKKMKETLGCSCMRLKSKKWLGLRMKQLIDSRNATRKKMQENKAGKSKHAPNFHQVKEDFVEMMDLDQRHNFSFECQICQFSFNVV